MRRAEIQKTLLQVVRQRNFAYIITSFLAVSNVLLVLVVYKSDHQTILIPQFQTDHRVSLTHKYFSKEYLVDWADGITRMVYTVNPETVEKRIADVLFICVSSRGNVLKAMDEWKKIIKENRISTVFYPKTFEVSMKDQTVQVRGSLMTYFGEDRKPVVEDKIYELGWERGNGTAIFLKVLKEITHD